MGTSLAAALEALAEPHARLNAADDRLLAAIAKVEAALRRHLNIRVSVPWINDELAFGKHDGHWALLWKVGKTVTPLQSCPRDVRVAAFTEGVVEALIRGASAQIDESIMDRKAALDEAQRLLDALGAEPEDRRTR